MSAIPDDFAPSRPRAVPCVPRHPSVPATAGPRETDEQPMLISTPSNEAAKINIAPYPDEQQVPQWDPLTGRPPCAIYPGKLCHPDCEHGLVAPCVRTCCVCGKEITELFTALVDQRGTMHFDCKDAPAVEPKVYRAEDMSDELEQARQARDLLNRLVDENKIRVGWDCGDTDPVRIDGPLVVSRLVPRVDYDEEPLP